MTITLPGHANTKYLGAKLAEQFPAMAGKTQVICTTDRRSGSRVTIMTNATTITAEAIAAYVRDLSAQVVASAVEQDAVLTPVPPMKHRRRQ